MNQKNEETLRMHRQIRECEIYKRGLGKRRGGCALHPPTVATGTTQLPSSQCRKDSLIYLGHRDTSGLCIEKAEIFDVKI